MSFIGETLLSAVITALFDKLSSMDVLQFARQEQIDADLRKWKKILVMIKAVLDDAEEKQTTDQLVEMWLGDLKKLAYDVEDILDEFATEALRRKLLDEPQASTGFKVRKLIPTCFSGFNPRSRKLNSAMAFQIKEITTRLQDILELKNSFGFIENSGARSNRAIYQRPPATHLNEPHIYGREKDKDAILELLFKDDSARVSVISIQGMGGLGKTTLAQLAYNDARVKDRFDIKAWACVSEDFNIVRITKAILQCIASTTHDVDDLSMLHDKLKRELSGKKFCIVLDDVWNENYEEWTIFCRPFEAGSFGSKIVVTTRNHGVSSMVGTFPAYQLEALSNDDCLSIFTYHSLGKMDFSEHQDLLAIGEKIVKRCKGLPLAAKTLGGLLRGKVNSKDWNDVLDSNMWSLPEEKSGIIPALRVSYYYLPSHLKRCFTYCSIFPKDYVFHKEELILLWMAEGFLQTNSTEKQAEDLGEEYFDDLQSRSFFQRLRNDASWSVVQDFSTADWFDMHDFSTADRFDMHDFSNDRFVMHDLINDLAQWAAKDFCTRIENLQEGEKQWKISENLCHLACLIDRSNYDNFKESGAFNKMKSVRTFLALSSYSWQPNNYDDLLCKVFQLRCLRVLSLQRCYCISKLPNSIGDMRLLHHLDLSYTKIEFLPDSVNKLYNLESLLLTNCRHLKRLCSDMGSLIKLRHLNVSGVDKLEAMPLRIGKSTGLRTLQHFVVGKDMKYGLKELKDLKQLQEGLHISRLENVNDFVDAENANLNGKDGLKDIQLEWTSSNDVSNEKEIAAQVLEKLRPCQKLESLHIRGYRGIRFPRWLGDTSLSSLVSLTFEDCKNYASFPSIGQLSSLKKLVIRNIDGIESLGQEFYGHGYYSMAPFQSLEEFTIESLQDWKDWFPCGSGRNVEAFPCLQKLSIRKCSKLEGKLPEHLPSLKSLLIDDCEQWTVSIPRLPEDCTIQIANCKEVVLSSIKDCSSLSSMVHLLSGISSRVFLAEGFAEGFSKVEKLDIVTYDEPTSFLKSDHSIQELQSWKFSKRIGFVLYRSDKERLQQKELPGRCQYLILEGCRFPVKLEQALQSLSFLRGITIRKSKEIKFFPETCLPSQLRFIIIDKCDALQSLPMAWMHNRNTSLEELSITNCDSLTCIARVQLPPNLKRLVINHCSNLLTVLDEEEAGLPSQLRFIVIEECVALQSLPTAWMHSSNTSLEELSISRCHSLTCIARVQLPPNLKRLMINQCSNLLTVLDEEEVSGSCKNTSCLEKLKIEDCPSLTSLWSSSGNLPKALRYLSITECTKLESIAKGFHDNTKLEKLYLLDCEKLETLPRGINNLISLKKLIIGNCPAMVSIPEGDFPTSLTFLVIRDTKICRSFFEWGLHRLTSLELLGIAGCLDVISFPQEEIGMILPTSLTSLMVVDFPNLEGLSSIAQNLTCLEKLCLSNCPNLKYFPDDGLPQSLKELQIEDCPLLEERCKEGEGLYWPIISHLKHLSDQDTSDSSEPDD